MIRPSLLISLPLFVASPVAAQVNGRLLRDGMDEFTVMYGGTVVGHSYEETTPTLVDGAEAWIQVYTFQGIGGGKTWDSLWVDVRTLRPLREARGSMGLRTDVRFAPKAVTMYDYRAGDTVVTVTPYAGTLYAAASLADVASTLPLAEGMATTVQLFHAHPAPYGLVSATIQVTGSTTIEARGRGPREAWIVTARSPVGTQLFWIDKGDRKLLQYEINDDGGRTEFRPY